MASFSERMDRLDRQVFDRLSDGEVMIDGQSIAAIYEEGPLMIGDGQGLERMIIISDPQARLIGIKPTRTSKLEWKGKPENLAIPPIYESGLIKLVLA
ncbi:hypothetical protein [Vibrio furnissii]|uniref:hypothetical protein n=1 Tax=Vibrio furnissii TaxID=29494 RepID=UPI001EEC9C3E|nr:hypothetical protein [Vibrio furnissii]MCG6216269.1 hypothetical protein [Vibrio furnissii]